MIYWKPLKEAFELSRSASPDRGWTPLGFPLAYEKTHSYGEFIFDWAWAEAYARYGLSYYPKLVCMIPFTPATTRHFSTEDELNNFCRLYDEGVHSSAHVLFLEEDEVEKLRQRDFLIRTTYQYHFLNKGYRDFSDFLSDCRGKKAKQLRKERIFPDITIQQFTQDSLSEEQARRMYRYYISTIESKNSFDYLTEEFFLLLFKNLKDHVLFVEASDRSGPIAGSLFYYDEEKLYGRYWGSHKFVDFLHFELCCYQGIDFALSKGLKVFEAGAQGEHKIARGFTPRKIFSAHKLRESAFSNAVANFLKQEEKMAEEAIRELSRQLPLRTVS